MKNLARAKRRSPMERGLKVLAVYSVLLCIVPAMGIGVVIVKSKASDVVNITATTLAEQRLTESTPSAAIRVQDNICTTPGCVLAAANILENIDKDVEPCDDFYKFACGGFFKEIFLADDSIGASAFGSPASKVRNRLTAFFERPNPSMEVKPFNLAKNLYNSCMNKTAIEAQGPTPLLGILKKLGGWPVLENDSWNEETFNWIQSNYKIRDLGYSANYFFTFYINVDPKNSTRRVIYLHQASLGLSREYLSKGLDDKMVKAYYSYMVDIAVILGAQRHVAEKELQSSLEFEMKLANISLPNDELRNATLLYNPMTIAQLSKTYPSIPWKEYCNHLLPPSIQVNDSEVVIVTVPSFIESLEKLMAETPKRVQANYAMWRIAATSVSYLTNEMRERELQYMSSLFGITARGSRWEECVGIVSRSFSISIGALYVRKHFHGEAKKDAIEMVDDIRKQFHQILQKVDWMDDETKKNALEKADSMTNHIAYPDELLDDSKLEEYYRDLQLNDESYLQGILNLTLFKTRNSFGALREPVNKSHWVEYGSPAVVNAFYSLEQNSIKLPAGILQGLFFSHDRPRYMNYGAIGSVIGHEITHGFDDQGRQFDKEGNLVDWWEPATKEKYFARAQCIIDQYGNYSVEQVGMNLNGITTQGENIADNGGIKAAYLAYRDWAARNREEKMLPGLPYTPRQMFWMSAANNWCSVYRSEVLKDRITTGVHSPGEFRVLGPFSNMPEFAEDFKCPVGSKMNPKNKCVVW